MKFLVTLLLFCLVLPSCNTDRTAEKERLELVSGSFGEAQLTFVQKSVQLNSIQLNYPNFSSKIFNSLVKQLILRDTIGVFCTEQENLNITYKVEHYSKNLLCLSKLVKVKCPMGNKNFQINEVQTYFQNNDSIFKVEFEAHANFKKDLLTQLDERSMSRCTKPDLNQLNFILRKGKFYVHVPYDFPMCNTEIPFRFEKNTVKVASLSPVDLN
jgi:hypothetical protein